MKFNGVRIRRYRTNKLLLNFGQSNAFSMSWLRDLYHTRTFVKKVHLKIFDKPSLS